MANNNEERYCEEIKIPEKFQKNSLCLCIPKESECITFVSWEKEVKNDSKSLDTLDTTYSVPDFVEWIYFRYYIVGN